METKGDISRKSIGALIDELVTTDIKCFMAQETVMKRGPAEEVKAAAIKAQETNGRRNELIRAIDSYFGDPNAPTSKTYMPESAQGESDTGKPNDFLSQYVALDEALNHNLKHGTPTPVIDGMGQAEQVREFWEKFGTLTENPDEIVIKFKPEMLAENDIGVVFRGDAVPIIFDGEKSCRAVDYAYHKGWKLGVIATSQKFCWWKQEKDMIEASPDFDDLLQAYDWMYEKVSGDESQTAAGETKPFGTPEKLRAVEYAFTNGWRLCTVREQFCWVARILAPPDKQESSSYHDDLDSAYIWMYRKSLEDKDYRW